MDTASCDSLLPAPTHQETCVDLKTDSPTDDQRRVIFAALVALQDTGTDVSRSRVQVARRFGLTQDVMRAIEREGISNAWPPL